MTVINNMRPFYDLAIKFENACPSEREDIILTERLIFQIGITTLLRYFAEEGYKQNSIQLLQFGLYLHLIENSRMDYQGNLMGLALLYRSIEKLKLNPDEEFIRAANLGFGKGKKMLIKFIDRPERNKKIEAMGHIEQNDPEFHYAYLKSNEYVRYVYN